MPKSRTRSRASSTKTPASPPAEAWKQRPEYVDGFVYDPAAAARVIKFIETFCRRVGDDGRNHPVKLLDWHKTGLIEPVFGWKHPDGRRRYRKAGLFVPKKNTKSSLMSWLTQYFLVADFPLSDVFGAAVDREQARIIFRMVAKSIQASPELSKVLEVIDSRSVIVNKEHGNYYRCLSADAFRNEGLNGKVIVDEIHAHKTPDLVDALIYATRATRNGLVMAISTAGDNRAGIGWQWWQDCEMVTANPKSNPTFYGKIYAARPDEGDDIGDPAVWRKANPSLGIVFPEDEFAADYQDAMTNPRKLGRFLRYSLNVWSAPDGRFFKPDAWAACGEPLRPFGDRPVYAGLDLATTYDLTALVLACPDPSDGSVDLLPFFWIPEANAVERSNRDKVDYLSWVREGHIRVTQGNVTDYTVLHRDILAICEEYKVRTLAVDLKHNGQMLANMLQGDGVEVRGFPQGGRAMSAPMRSLENLVTGGKVRHAGHPVLGWCANNTVCHETSKGEIFPSKSKSTERIDGIIATCEALAVWLGNEQSQTAAPEIFFL